MIKLINKLYKYNNCYIITDNIYSIFLRWWFLLKFYNRFLKKESDCLTVRNNYFTIFSANCAGTFNVYTFEYILN